MFYLMYSSPQPPGRNMTLCPFMLVVEAEVQRTNALAKVAEVGKDKTAIQHSDSLRKKRKTI